MVLKQELKDSFDLMKKNKKAPLVINEFYNVFKNESDYSFKKLCDLLREKYNFDFEKFDAGNSCINIGFHDEESAIEKLFKEKDGNNDLEIIIPKVAIVNQLYSAGLNSTSEGHHISIVEMSRQINNLAGEIDNFTENGNVFDLVNKLASGEDIKTSGGSLKYNALAFASKYLSFYFRNKGIDIVPITDSNTRRILSYIRGVTESSLEKYENFYNTITVLINELNNEIEDKRITYKEFDSFLWIMGKVMK